MHVYSIYVYFSLFQIVSGECLIYSVWPSPLFRNVFGIFLFSIEFFIPLFILVYCYGCILWTLTRRLDQRWEKTCNINQISDTFQTARKNVIQTFLIVSICFVACWSCEQVYYLLFNLGFNADFNGMFFKFSVVLAFGNCTINPFIYLFKYKDYQLALKRWLPCSKRRKSDCTSNVNSVSLTQDTNVND